MEKLFEFLNQQSGDRLAGYAVVFIIVSWLVSMTISSVIYNIFKRNRNGKTD